MPKKESFLSPRGVAMWPRLNTPDKQFKTEGEYKVALRLAGTDAKVVEFIETLQTSYDEHIAEEKKLAKKGKPVKPVDPPWKKETDENGAETGNWIVKFALLAQVGGKDGRAGFTQAPQLFDAKNQKLPANVIVGSGSSIKVAGKIHKWNTPIGAGVSLRLNAVQVLDLKAPGADPTMFGFAAEEDGYSPEAAAASDTTGDEVDPANPSESAGDDGDY